MLVLTFRDAMVELGLPSRSGTVKRVDYLLGLRQKVYVVHLTLALGGRAEAQQSWRLVGLSVLCG